MARPRLPKNLTREYRREQMQRAQQEAINQQNLEEAQKAISAQEQANAQSVSNQQAQFDLDRKLLQKYESGTLSQDEFSKLFQKQYLDQYGKKESDATEYAYYKYKVSKGKNLSQDEERNFAVAGSALGKEIRKELGGGLNKVSVSALQKQKEYLPVGGFSAVGGGVGVATYNTTTGNSPANISGGASPRYATNQYQILVQGKQIELVASQKGGGFLANEIRQVEYIPKASTVSKPKDVQVSGTSGEFVNGISTVSPEPEFMNKTVPFFDTKQAVDTAVDFLAPEVPDRRGSFSSLGLKSPRIFFPQIGLLGAVEFGVSGLLVGGLTPALQKGTYIKSKDFGFSEQQTVIAVGGATLGLSLVGFGATSTTIGKLQGTLLPVSGRFIDLKRAKSTQLEGLVGSGSGSSFVEGDVFIKTKYKIPFGLETSVPKLFSKKKSALFPTRAGVSSFLRRVSTVEKGGEFSGIFTFEKKAIKPPERIVEPYTSSVYKENLIASSEAGPQTTFLPLSAEGKVAKSSLSSQAQVVKSEISLGVNAKLGAKNIGNTELDTSEFIVKQTGQLKIRGDTFRSKSFPFGRKTRVDVVPESIAFGGTSVQSTKSIQGFISVKENKSLSRIDTLQLPKEQSVFQGSIVRESPIAETIVSEQTKRRGIFSSISGSGEVTGGLREFNVKNPKPPFQGLSSGTGSFNQTVFKRSFESGEKTGVEFGSSESRVSLAIDGVNYVVNEKVFLEGTDSFIGKRSKQLAREKSVSLGIESKRLRSTDFGQMQTKVLQEQGVIPNRSAFSGLNTERFPVGEIVPNIGGVTELFKTTAETQSKSVSSTIQVPLLGVEIGKAIQAESVLPRVISKSKLGFVLGSQATTFFSGYTPQRIQVFNKKKESLAGKPLLASQLGNKVSIVQKSRFTGFVTSSSLKGLISTPESSSSTRLVSSSSSVSKIKPVVVPVQRPLTKNISTPIMRPVNVSLTRPITSPATRPITRPLTRPMISTKTTPVTIPITRPITTPVTTPITIPITTPITRPITTPRVTPILTPNRQPPLIPILPKTINSKKKGFGSQAFSLVTKIRGKTKTLAGRYTKRDAFAAGTRLVKGTLRASFQTKPVPGLAEQRNLSSAYIPGLYVSKKGFFVQPRSQRLSQKSEVSEIQLFKSIKKNKGSGFI